MADKMRVRMLTTIAGVPAYRDGQIIELETRIALEWIREGYCEPVRQESAETAATRK